MLMRDVQDGVYKWATNSIREALGDIHQARFHKGGTTALSAQDGV